MPLLELDFVAIGRRIKIARIKQGITQEIVAEKIGISPQHVSNIETGNARVSLTALVSIANLLKVSVDELLCDNILFSKPVFEKEASEVLEDCNEYEIRIMIDLMKTAKSSIRNVKLFESALKEIR